MNKNNPCVGQKIKCVIKENRLYDVIGKCLGIFQVTWFDGHETQSYPVFVVLYDNGDHAEYETSDVEFILKGD